MHIKATTLTTRSSESTSGSASPEPRTRRLRTERQCFIASPHVSGVLAARELSLAIESHLRDFESGTFSRRTLTKKREFLGYFQWFINQSNHAQCDVEAVRAYFAYLNNSHEEPNGRWGNGRVAKPLRPATIDTHYRVLSAFFNWLIREERISVSPMVKVNKPKVPDDQIQPFSLEQMVALLSAAKKSRYPKRDYAIVALFYDTGMRASELANLRVGDIDWAQKSFSILGKGNKRRVVHADTQVVSAITSYLQQEGSIVDMDDKEFVFISQRGTNAGEAMNRNALYKLIRRLGKEAGIKNVRCSPHTIRHSYALETVRNGGNLFALQRFLGHTSLKMSNKYVALADADLKSVHEQTSPMDSLKKRKRGR